MTSVARLLPRRRSLVVAMLLVQASAVAAWAQQNHFPSVGNAGIGTDSPAAPLHVGTSVAANAKLLQIGEPGFADSYGLVLRGDPTTGVFALNGLNAAVETSTPIMSWTRYNGRVGIGTNSPAAPLHVGTSVAANAKLLQIGEPGFADGYGVVLRGDPTTGVFTLNGLNAGVETSIPIMSWTRQSGWVGIGTSSPLAAFHVTGDARIDGNIAAKYQDVAEWVEAIDPLTAGSVVIIDPSTRNHVTAASAPYDTRVAGVVSPRPGLLLGEEGPNKVKVAQSGRLKVRVDAGYGAVAIGDLLVTSPTRGFAMRSEPVSVGGTSIHRPGTLLGKALEPLADGQGEIMVLLTLQ